MHEGLEEGGGTVRPVVTPVQKDQPCPVGADNSAGLSLWTLLGIALLLPLVPFLLLGHRFEDQLTRLLEQPGSQLRLAGLTFGLLASDILLPVPSSAVATLAGKGLGVLWGTAVCWLGLTVGGMVGFLAARLAGRRLALRLVRSGDLAMADAWWATWGTAGILLLRPAPLLAEASVLVAGIAHVPWPRFFFALGVGNLAATLPYTALGSWLGKTEWLPYLLCAASAVPLIFTWQLRKIRGLRGQSGLGESAKECKLF